MRITFDGTGTVHIHGLGGEGVELRALPVLGSTDDGPRTGPAVAAARTTGTPPACGEVWPGQGGRFICTMPALLGQTERHLIAAMEDAPKQLAYGPYADTDGTTNQVNGRANMAAPLAHGERHPAAEWCAKHVADGHADFYLPSRVELLFAWLHAPQLFEKAGYYWSSTQISRYYAFVQDFEYGNSRWLYKDDEYRVRAFRAIPVNA